MRPNAVSVEARNDYTLLIEFDNGEKRIFDVKPYFAHKLFKELEDMKKFNSVRIAGLSIEWSNGADICPDELYNNSVLDNC